MKNNIVLRQLHEKDAPFMLEWMKDKEVARNFRFEAGNATMQSVCGFIEASQNMETNANFAITEANSDEYLGTVSLKNIDKQAKSAEYAIVLRKKAQGKQCGAAATAKILEYAYYTLELERVYLNVLSTNEKAIRFYEAFGFVYEGEFVNHVFVHGAMHSLKWFRLMKAEYESACSVLGINKLQKRNTIEDIKIFTFPELGDDRGEMVVIEGRQHVPFAIKRIFYMYGSDPNVVRGQHANKLSAFCFINVKGTSKVKAIDCNGNEKVFVLDSPNTGVYLPAMIWKEMYDFSADSVLLVLSDAHYDANEYMRDMDEFLRKA